MSVEKAGSFVTSNDGDRGRNKDGGNDNNHHSSIDMDSNRNSSMGSNRDRNRGNNRIQGNNMVQDRVARRGTVQLQHTDFRYP